MYGEKDGSKRNWDRQGDVRNIYVVEWIQEGRVTKLKKV